MSVRDPARPIRLGIVGANAERGWARDAHLPALQRLPQFEIAAVSARSQALADAAAAAFGARRGYGDTVAMINDPEVEVVVVTVRVPEHRAAVLAAVEAGKHVYCEWPLGRTLAETTEMARAVRPGQHAMVGAQGLAAPATRRALSLLKDGAIGAPKVLRCYNTAAAWGRSVATRSYLQDKSSGATLATIGMGHVLPVVDALVGPWLEVDARSSLLYEMVEIEGEAEPVRRTCEDHVLALGRHASGCVSTLEVIGGVSKRPSSIEIVGETGWLRIFGTVPGTYQIARLDLEGSMPVGALPAPVAPDLVGPPANLAEVYLQMHADLTGGRQTLPSFDDAVRVAALMDAIDAASQTGARQTLAERPG